MTEQDNVHILKRVEGMDILEQLTRELEADLETRGWDQPPMYLVLLNDPTKGMGLVTISMPETCYEDPGSAFPAFVSWLKESWDSDGQGNSSALSNLPLMARKMLTHIVKMFTVSPSFYGFAMFSEGWKVSRKTPEGTSYDEAMELFRDLTPPSQSPDRVEQRFGFVCTIDGGFVGIVRDRGGFPEYLDHVAADVHVGGRVADALRVLTTVCQDVLS